MLRFCREKKVRATPGGHISGWHLHPSGRRARGPIFRFSLDSSPSSAPPPTDAAGAAVAAVARPLTSMDLAAGGMILAVAREGAAPCLLDMRLARRARPPRTGGAAPVRGRRSCRAWRGGGGRVGGSGGGDGDGGGRSGVPSPHPLLRVWGLASRHYPAEVLEGRGGDHGGGGRGWEEGELGAGVALQVPLWGAGGGGEGEVPRRVRIRPWPAGAWAVGVAVDLGGGRLASACSDGRLR